MTQRSVTRPRTMVLALVCDLASVIIFVVIGRGSHEREATLLGLWETAWPFLAGLALSWLIAAIWKRPRSLLRSGLPVWIGTVVLGLLLRGITGGGTATAFVIVTILVLGAFLLGWRASTTLVLRTRRA